MLPRLLINKPISKLRKVNPVLLSTAVAVAVTRKTTVIVEEMELSSAAKLRSNR